MVLIVLSTLLAFFLCVSSAGILVNTVTGAGALPNAFLAFLLVVLLSLFIYCAIRKAYRVIDLANKQIAITISLFLFMLVMLVVLIASFRIDPIGDSLDDIDVAFYLSKNDSVTNENIHAPFICAYGNNYVLILLIREIFIMFPQVQVDEFLKICYALNTAFILIATFFLWKSIVEEFPGKIGYIKANKVLLLCVLNPVFYILVFWIYSLIPSLALLSITMYLCIKYRIRRNVVKSITLDILLGIVLFLGFHIRPTAIFPFIAMIVSFIFARKRILQYLKHIGIVFIVFVCLELLLQNPIKQCFGEVMSKNLPASYWLSLGSHGEGTLSTQNQADMSYLLNMDGTKWQKEICGLEQALSYYKENGFFQSINLWLRKIVTTWGDGYSGINERLLVGVTEPVAIEYLVGNNRQLLYVYSQSYRLILYIGGIKHCIDFRKELQRQPVKKAFACCNERSKWYSQIYKINIRTLSLFVIFGGFIFYMLWESEFLNFLYY